MNEAPVPLSFPRYRGSRALTIEGLQKEVLTLDQEKQELEKNDQSQRTEIAGLLAQNQSLEAATVRLEATIQGLEATLSAVQQSVGWQVLNKWRGMREHLLPNGSFTRKVYDSLLRLSKGALRSL